MDWTTEIGCEGGPVLVSNARDFRSWFGSEPYPENRRRELCFYSPFTRELPAKFQANGVEGHLYFPCENPAALREELISSVLELFPDARINRSGDTWVVTRGDGRKLRASLEPSSEYAVAIRSLGQDRVYEWGNGSTCYLWSIEPGIVQLNVRRNHSELLMSQITYLEPDVEKAEPLSFALVTTPPNQTGCRYRITGGPVVVSWSPNSSNDLQPGVDIDAPSAGTPGRTLDLATGSSGASIWMQPGWYVARTGYHETERWSLSWCQIALAAE